MSFCVMPFLSAYIHPTGDVGPCCHSFPNKEAVMGNIKNESLESIFNNTKFKQFRLDLKNNLSRSDICKKCYLQEDNNIESFRLAHNKQFQQHITYILDNTDQTGFITPEIKYLDVRFSNLCNMKCRTCYSELSSTWAKENKKIPYVINASNNIIDILKHQLKNIETIYFAGGEPLLMEEHYNLLTLLINEKYAPNIELSYNTNLSSIQYKNNNFIDLWKQFKNVNIMVSIDGIKDKAEYIRHGTKWSTIEKNIKNLKEHHSNVSFNTVISLLNVKDIPEIIDYFIKHKLADSVENFNLSILIYPTYLNISNMPDQLKNEITIEYQNYLKLNNSTFLYTQFNSIIDNMNNSGTEFNKFIVHTRVLDHKRQQNIVKTIPYFEKYFKSVTKL